MVPRNTRTIIIKSGFTAGLSHAGVASIIANSMAGLVDLIQVCPGGIICVSFLDPAHKKTYEEAGFISFGDVRCDIVVSTPITFVMVYLFTFEGSNDRVRLRRFVTSSGQTYLVSILVPVLYEWCANMTYHATLLLMA